MRFPGPSWSEATGRPELIYIELEGKFSLAVARKKGLKKLQEKKKKIVNGKKN